MSCNQKLVWHLQLGRLFFQEEVHMLCSTACARHQKQAHVRGDKGCCTEAASLGSLAIAGWTHPVAAGGVLGGIQPQPQRVQQHGNALHALLLHRDAHRRPRGPRQHASEEGMTALLHRRQTSIDRRQSSTERIDVSLTQVA